MADERSKSRNEMVSSLYKICKETKMRSLWDELELLGSILGTSSIPSQKKHEDIIVGKGRVEKPLKLKRPLLCPLEWLNSFPIDARIGVTLGQSLSGQPIYLDGREPKEVLEVIGTNSRIKVLRLGPNREGIDLKKIMKADAIEIIPCCITGKHPQLLPEMMGPKDLIGFVDMLKELTDVPVIVEIDPIHVVDDIDKVLVTRTDAIHINFWSGCSYDHLWKGCNSSISSLSSLITATEHMKTFRSRDNGVLLITTPDMRSPMDILKCFALGSDIVGIDSFIYRMLLGFDRESNDENMKFKDMDFDWAEISEVTENLFSSLILEMNSICEYLGSISPGDLSRNNLRAMTYDAAALTGLPISGLNRSIPIWRH